jgi:hypothetical protein
MSANEISNEVHAAGRYPHKVGIQRTARLSDDLDCITWRYMSGIKVYNGNDVAMVLNLDQARELSESLAYAVEQAAKGPLGDLT